MHGIGQNFDEFMQEQGLYDEAKELAAKRIIVLQLSEEMKRQAGFLQDEYACSVACSLQLGHRIDNYRLRVLSIKKRVLRACSSVYNSLVACTSGGAFCNNFSAFCMAVTKLFLSGFSGIK